MEEKNDSKQRKRSTKKAEDVTATSVLYYNGALFSAKGSNSK